MSNTYCQTVNSKITCALLLLLNFSFAERSSAQSIDAAFQQSTALSENERSQLNLAPDQLLRWEVEANTLRVLVLGDDWRSQLDSITDNLSISIGTVQAITGKDLSVVTWGEMPETHTIYFVIGNSQQLLDRINDYEDRFDYPGLTEFVEREEAERSEICASGRHVSPSGEIVTGLIVAEVGDFAARCFNVGLLRVLGLTNEIESGFPSMISRGSSATNYTNFDIALLRRLYQ